jgi:2-polyprenyl-3-methyl-5-hydroxy-6-metoxy-1,4-benzoquinol methylase
MSAELEFFLAHLPQPPARVLEVGCGDGTLARALAETYEVTAIDPAAPEGAIFRRERIEDHTGGPYDAIVASSSLHHVHDLDAVVAQLASLAPLLLLSEFAWERLDARGAAWLAQYMETDRWDAAHAHHHTGAALREALARMFDERAYVEVPYLYRFASVPAEAEQAALAAGEVQQLGFFYAGVSRL